MYHVASRYKAKPNFAKKGNVRVFVCIRKPDEGNDLAVWKIANDRRIDLDNEFSKSFEFDQIFLKDETQEEIFKLVAPLVKHAHTL
jgi:hypothetical protein